MLIYIYIIYTGSLVGVFVGSTAIRRLLPTTILLCAVSEVRIAGLTVCHWRGRNLPRLEAIIRALRGPTRGIC